MSGKLIRDAFIICTAVFGGFYGLIHREAIYEFIGVHPRDFVQSSTDNVNMVAPEPASSQKTTMHGSSASIPKAKDGQFWTEAKVNTTVIRFLVDTGASVVALTPMDAKRAGFRTQDLHYTSPINTASGQIMGAPIHLSRVSVGNVTVRNVRAVVIPKGLSHSLLGMSYLGKLQKVEASRKLLILRK